MWKRKKMMKKASIRRCSNDSNEGEVDECAMDCSRFASSQVIYKREVEDFLDAPKYL